MGRYQQLLNYLLIIAYPIAAHVSVSEHFPAIGLTVLALLLINQVKLSLFRDHPYLATMLTTAIVGSVGMFVYSSSMLLLYFPPIVITIGLLSIFGSSLLPHRQALITAFVSKIYEHPAFDVQRYTRNVTILWTCFFIAMTIETLLLSLFASQMVWSLFCNLLNYIFIGSLFFLESLYRRHRFGRTVSNLRLIKMLIETRLSDFTKKDFHKKSCIPILGHHDYNEIFAMNNGREINCWQFLRDVESTLKKLPEKKYLIDLCENRYNFCVAFIAAILKGQTLLLPHNDSKETLHTLCERYPSSYVLYDGDLSLSGSDAKCHEFHFVDPVIAANHVAAIVFTSGTTGNAAPWEKRWGDLVAHTHETARNLKISRQTPHHVVATVPSQHMFGLEHAIIMPMQYGDIINAQRPFFSEDIKSTIMQTTRPTILLSTPLHLRVIAGSNITHPNMRMVISATAELSPNLAGKIEQQFSTRLMEIYGCTEAGAIAIRHTATSHLWSLLKDNTLTLKEKSVFLNRKLLNHPVNAQIELSDIIQIKNKHTFSLVGRKSDNINIAGKRISLQRLNDALLSIQGVEDGVYFMPDEQPGKLTRLCAFVVTEVLSERQIIDALRSRVASTFLPRPVIKLARLPRNKTDKIERQRLIELLESRRRVVVH